MIGNIVKYNFFALENVDEETYSLDYAIVIDVDEAKNEVKILPITNTFCKDSIESFCLGKINGFVEIRNEGYKELKQYVRFDKMLTVGLDEIYNVNAQDEFGNIDCEMPTLTISEDQLEKVMNKYNEYKGDDTRNVVNLLLKADPKYILNLEKSTIASDMDVYLKKMDKYREYNYQGQKIIVFFVEGNRYSLVMDASENTDKNYRNEQLKLALAS